MPVTPIPPTTTRLSLISTLLEKVDNPVTVAPPVMETLRFTSTSALISKLPLNVDAAETAVWVIST